MTIDSMCSSDPDSCFACTHCVPQLTGNWVKVLKEEAPDAFTQQCRFQAKCAVLDGMPMLMAGGHIEVGGPIEVVVRFLADFVVIVLCVH
jgi:hypothetical protein